MPQLFLSEPVSKLRLSPVPPMDYLKSTPLKSEAGTILPSFRQETGAWKSGSRPWWIRSQDRGPWVEISPWKPDLEPTKILPEPQVRSRTGCVGLNDETATPVPLKGFLEKNDRSGWLYRPGHLAQDLASGTLKSGNALPLVPEPAHDIHEHSALNCKEGREP